MNKEGGSNNDSNDDSNNKTRVGGIVLDGAKNLLVVFGNVSKKWGVPKGYHEEGKETYVEGALREIKEETGLMLEPVNSETLKYWKFKKARLYILYIDDIKPTVKPIDTVEISEARWVDIKNPEEIQDIEKNANQMLIAIIKKLRKISNIDKIE